MAQGCPTPCSVDEEGHEGGGEWPLNRACAAAGFPSAPGNLGWIPVSFVFFKVGRKKPLASLLMKQDAIESHRIIEAGKDHLKEVKSPVVGPLHVTSLL